MSDNTRWSPWSDVPVAEYVNEPDQPTRREPERRIVERQYMSPFDLRAFRTWRENDVDRYHAEVKRWTESHGWSPERIINGGANV